MNPDLALFLFGLLAMFALIAVVLRAKLRAPRRKVWRHYGVLLLATVALTGCSGPLFVTRAVPVPLVTEVPFEHVTTRTVTDQATGNIERSQVTNVVSMAVTNWTTNVVVEVSQHATRALAAVGAVNDAVNDVAPNPVSGVLSVALGGIAGVLGWLAKLKTKQARERLDLLDTVIAGVEQADVPAVKETIAKVSRAWGTAPALAERVQFQTLPGMFKNPPA